MNRILVDRNYESGFTDGYAQAMEDMTLVEDPDEDEWDVLDEPIEDDFYWDDIDEEKFPWRDGNGGEV
jgi:hypothetical protein